MDEIEIKRRWMEQEIRILQLLEQIDNLTKEIDEIKKRRYNHNGSSPLLR